MSRVLVVEDEAHLAQGLRHWQGAASHPGLVSHVYVWRSSAAGQLLNVDVARNQNQVVDWPAEFQNVQTRLQAIATTQVTLVHRPIGSRAASSAVAACASRRQH